jgi:hypothetical protein
VFLHAAAPREASRRRGLRCWPRRGQPIAEPELLKQFIGVCSRKRSSDVVGRDQFYEVGIDCTAIDEL